jgi:hypothetical protein
MSLKNKAPEWIEAGVISAVMSEILATRQEFVSDAGGRFFAAGIW